MGGEGNRSGAEEGAAWSGMALLWWRRGSKAEGGVMGLPLPALQVIGDKMNVHGI